MASELAIEIAMLQGWTEINTGSPGAIGHYGIHPKTKLKATVPEPDWKPADCLELIRYLLQQKLCNEYPFAITQMEYNADTRLWQVRIEATQPFGYDPTVMIGTGNSWGGQADTLELAISPAVRDALRDFREIDK